MPKDTPSHLCGRHSHDFTGGLVAGRLRGTLAVQPCETTVVCCLERGIKTCRECRARHIQGEATRWTVERSAKARAEAKGSKDSKDSETRTRTPLNVGNVESAVSTLEVLLERVGPDQRWWFKGKEHKPDHNGC